MPRIFLKLVFGTFSLFSLISFNPAWRNAKTHLSPLHSPRSHGYSHPIVMNVAEYHGASFTVTKKGWPSRRIWGEELNTKRLLIPRAPSPTFPPPPSCRFCPESPVPLSSWRRHGGQIFCIKCTVIWSPESRKSQSAVAVNHNFRMLYLTRICPDFRW
jgi:hypothetical protein